MQKRDVGDDLANRVAEMNCAVGSKQAERNGEYLEYARY